MPESRVVFGILTMTGSCMLVMIVLERGLRHIPEVPGAAVSLALFVLTRNINIGTLGFERYSFGRLPAGWYRNLVTAYLGFPPGEFYSTDYFSLFPWIFLFVTGYFLFRIFRKHGWNETLFLKGNLPVFGFLGRHSLIIYLIHQPVLYGLFHLLL